MHIACLPPAALVSPALAFLEGIGAGEMLLVAVIGLLLFGGKGLPDMARTVGKAVREFKKATASVEEEVRRVMNEEPETKSAPRPRRLPTTTPGALPAPEGTAPAAEPAAPAAPVPPPPPPPAT